MSYKYQDINYTPLFCEENIWQYAKLLLDQGTVSNRMFVLFFSNPFKSVMLFQQQTVKPGHYTVWDYHVVLQVHQQGVGWIYDFESRLPFPSLSSVYFSQTFPNHHTLPENYQTLIRQIPATAYLKHFYSDRSHMDANLHEFPSHPIIKPDNPDEPIPLDDYCNMNKQLSDHSLVFDLEHYPDV